MWSAGVAIPGSWWCWPPKPGTARLPGRRRVAATAGLATLAHGGDFGGSVRTPASFCGHIGYRPTPGLIPGPTNPLVLACTFLISLVGFPAISIPATWTDSGLPIGVQLVARPAKTNSSSTPRSGSRPSAASTTAGPTRPPGRERRDDHSCHRRPRLRAR
ncbi:amidase family protein [Saccharopolyspora elongata]|uniref:amidase family protein n=1 Tax=Saccharopolyspora elongata TaxID=2530387 RepID=UPI001404E291|nr:amidase family protein [Saccharopolyspora elongata]